MRNKLYISGL